MDRFENFTVSILKLNKLIHKIKLYEMEEYGLRAIHVMCVYYLNARGSLTAGELTKLTLEDKAATSRALKTLQENGYISYDKEGYNAHISLTPAGRAVAEKIDLKSKSAVESAGGQLTDKERETLYSSLSAIIDNLEKYYDSLPKK